MLEVFEVYPDVLATTNPTNCGDKAYGRVRFHHRCPPPWMRPAKRSRRCDKVGVVKTVALASKALKVNPERKLNLTRWRHELGCAEAAVPVTDVIAEALWHRHRITERVHESTHGRRGYIQVVYLLHVCPVKEIEYFEASYSFYPLGKRDLALQAYVDVVVGIA